MPSFRAVIFCLLPVAILLFAGTLHAAECCTCKDGSIVPKPWYMTASCAGECKSAGGVSAQWQRHLTAPNCTDPCVNRASTCGVKGIAFVESIGRRCEDDWLFDDVYACMEESRATRLCKLVRLSECPWGVACRPASHATPGPADGGACASEEDKKRPPPG